MVITLSSTSSEVRFRPQGDNNDDFFHRGEGCAQEGSYGVALQFKKQIDTEVSKRKLLK
ncbi:hypothetical protein HPP92_022034 [Vanilla planifolia]|uniref:Uncharacterized protein n=1 Tax=Vanilla planifolia TaxID=51239 RepID=A0A835UGV3_VANPL|nr:hypothetical protein HPP92_022374 [Vanilla planifolia]KAG0458906.1 hypothetical protein HPP92_022034 [Vanilla planifolia]